jgi:oligopeptide/dipeptide ABC transporter ATP-binding protein
VTVHAQILKLFADLRREFGVAIVLITHDLGVVAELCERTLVMYAGRAVESGPTRDLLHAPAHPYTRALLQARPRLDGPLESRLQALPGQPPNPVRLPRGCAFAPRCPAVIEACAATIPAMETIGTDRNVACWRA